MVDQFDVGFLQKRLVMKTVEIPMDRTPLMLFSSVKVGEEDIVELPTSTTKLVSVSSVDVGKEGTSHGRDPVGLSSVKTGEDDMAYLPWRGDQVDAGFLHKDW